MVSGASRLVSSKRSGCTTGTVTLVEEDTAAPVSLPTAERETPTVATPPVKFAPGSSWKLTLVLLPAAMLPT